MIFADKRRSEIEGAKEPRSSGGNRGAMSGYTARMSVCRGRLGGVC